MRPHRTDVHRGSVQPRDVGQQLVLGLVGERVGLGDCQLGVGRDVGFGAQPVADPAQPQLPDPPDPVDGAEGVGRPVDQRRVDRVHQPGADLGECRAQHAQDRHGARRRPGAGGGHVVCAELAALTMAMPPRYRLLVQLAAFCALRFGELTELRRSDIDTQRGVIMVRRAVVLVNCRFVIRKPKSDAGVRDVAIPQALMATVWEHLLTYTAPGPDGLLFPSRNDPAEHLRQSSLTRVFYPARKAAGRPDLRLS